MSEMPPPTSGDPYQQGQQGQQGQQPYGQQPYGQPPYGAPQQPVYGMAMPPDHPQATTVLILGILGMVVCGIIAPFAWVMGTRVVAEIDASGGAIGGRSNASIGRTLGIIGTVLLGLGLLIGLAVVIFAVGGLAVSSG